MIGGTSVPGEQNLTPAQQVNDPFRRDFWAGHLQALSDAILIDKLPVKAFLAWSLIDNFEWNTYDQRFGAIGIDFNSNNRTRRVKDSTSYLSTYFANSKSPFTLPPVSTPAGGGSGGAKNIASSMSGYFDVIVSIILCFL